jgi:hypothetical protein
MSAIHPAPTEHKKHFSNEEKLQDSKQLICFIPRF